MFGFLLITLGVVAAYMLLMQFYAWGWILTPLLEHKDGFVAETKVSILVPARNEAGNIQNLLQCLQKQNYPKQHTEIIVINDHSTDDTAQLAEAMGITVLHLPANKQGKKAAITLGVANATGDLIITTDADCSMGSQWLPTLVRHYQNTNYKILTGPVTFAQPENAATPEGLSHKLLYFFQSLDLMGLMFITAGSLRLRFPHMANGANFAFERKLFLSLNGYQGIDATPSGDDILFLLKAHSHYPGCAGFVKSEEAIVTTQPSATWPAFWQQRRRWVSKADGFGDWRLTAILVFCYLYVLLMAVCFGAMLVWPLFVLPFMLLFLGKMLPEFVMLFHAARFFGKTKQLLWFLPAQLMHVGYILYIGAATLQKKYHWKDRSYKA